MLLKMNQHHAGNRNYVASKREGDTDFGIRHFAGEVFYDSRGAKAKINEPNICPGGGICSFNTIPKCRLPEEEQRRRQFGFNQDGGCVHQRAPESDV